MVIEQGDGRKELKDAHREIVLYLMKHGKSHRRDIARGIEKSEKWTNEKTKELNHAGAVEIDGWDISLKEDNLETEYTTDKYKGPVSLILGAWVAAFFLSLFTGILFFYGALLVGFASFSRILYKIFTVKEDRKVFIKQ